MTRQLGLDSVAFGYLQTAFGVLQLLGGPVFGRYQGEGWAGSPLRGHRLGHASFPDLSMGAPWQWQPLLHRRGLPSTGLWSLTGGGGHPCTPPPPYPPILVAARERIVLARLVAANVQPTELGVPPANLQDPSGPQWGGCCSWVWVRVAPILPQTLRRPDERGRIFRMCRKRAPEAGKPASRGSGGFPGDAGGRRRKGWSLGDMNLFVCLFV